MAWVPASSVSVVQVATPASSASEPQPGIVVPSL
jgi:hypothetical protein